MKATHHYGCWHTILVLVLCLAAAGPAQADPPRNEGSREKLAQKKEPASAVRRFLSPFFSSSSVHQRNHAKVREAFREVVAQARESTVRILCDDKPAALGAIVDERGYVVTKASELRGAISCRLTDDRVLPAELIGIHEDSDLAMVKVDAPDLVALEWSDVDSLPLGSWLATPALEESPAAVGVLSVSPRKIPRTFGVLGVRLEPANKGAKIGQVIPNSSAAKAGLQKNDVVTAINGNAVANHSSLIAAIRKFGPGDKVQLSVHRGDQRLDVTATLTDLSITAAGKRASFQNSLGGPVSQRRHNFPLALQHDTELRPEQCGGPLVGLDGRVVGINIARAGRVATYALPADSVRPLIDELKAGKWPPQPQPEPDMETVTLNGE